MGPNAPSHARGADADMSCTLLNHLAPWRMGGRRMEARAVTSTTTPPAPTDPRELVKAKSYVVLLVIGALIGVPVAAVAYFFLKIVEEAQTYLFTTLPNDLGFDG